MPVLKSKNFEVPMGVHGLWKLIEPAGKPIPLESLENKVLAVDVSIWLYQLTKGLQTTGGGSVANAHLLGLFNRICKLLYYRIKPVFVFDGGVPILKKETIEARKRLKRKAQDNSEQLREKLLNNLLKQNAVNQLLGNEDLPSTSAQVIDDMFTLPPLPEKEENDESDDESDTDVTTAKLESFCDSQYGKDLHSIDITSEQFKSLPAEIRHEILSELQETRKQNSWARVHEMPEQSQDFSKFQMERLRKRRNVQISLENAAKELGGRSMTLGELEAIFKEDGIVTDSLLSQRIVGDNVTRFIYVTGKSKEKQPADIPVQTEIVEESPKEKPAKKCKEFTESDFHKSIQTIEECIFINDSSSDEDFEIIDDPKNGDISQEDILKIIKREQNISDEQIEDESVEKISKIVETTSTPTINTGKSNDVDYVEATQTPDVWKTSSILSLSVSLTENNGPPGSSPKQCCSQLSNSNSYELFPDNAEETKSSVNLQPSLNREQELLKTLILEKSNESADSQEIRGSDSYPSSANRKEEFIKTLILEKSNDSVGAESLELFSESESDDGFVEVGTPNEPSLYFKESEKSVQISIQPVNEIEDDIFADVFDSRVSEEKISDEIKQVGRSDDEKVEKSTKPVQLADIFDKVKNVENQLKLTFEKSKNNSPRKKKTPEKNEQLTDIQKMLNDEKNELLADYGKQERFGSTITQQMVVEAQELLQLFGLPYVIAPMEAEAQCAFLDQISLTEGTITDDSDIWLFGGQKVYKNFFDNRKYVLQFRAVDIEHFFKLSREQLIQMALLVGSDYTVGIEGIGPVTALEILAYFSDPSNKPQTKGDIAETLRKFRIWIKNSRNNSCPLSKKCRNVTLSEAFPSRSVIEAYLYPTVEESKEGFTWATPDLDRIRSYMKSKFGWKTSRIDDILLPVMRRLSNKNKQSTLDSYFKAKPFAPLDFGNVSKRVIQAINVMKSKTNEDFLPIPSTSKSPKKREIVLKTPKRETTKKTRGKKASSKASLKSMSPHKASYFGNIIPQKEKDKLEAAKRKCEAIKIFQAKNKTKRKAKKLKTLPAKPDSSYLSESSSDEN